MNNKKYNFNYKDSPQATFGTFVSTSRNVYLTSSIGIALLTFARNFDKNKQIIRIISLSILLFSIIYGLTGNYNFYNYLKFLENQKDLPNFLKKKIKNWYNWIVITYIYIFIILFLFFIIVYQKILN